MDAELTARHARVREALERDGLDAALVCGSEYTGFEGAVTYLSGFQIVHRYAYVLVPRQGEPAIVFPAEARYVGEHGDSQIAEQVFADRPGEWLAERLRGQRVGVYGLDYVMTVRDYAALAGRCRARPVGRAVRPRARRQVRRRARLGARERRRSTSTASTPSAERGRRAAPRPRCSRRPRSSSSSAAADG